MGGRRTQASKFIRRGRWVIALEGEEGFRWGKLHKASVDNTENHVLKLTANKHDMEKQTFGS